MARRVVRRTWNFWTRRPDAARLDDVRLLEFNLMCMVSQPMMLEI